MRHLLSLSVIYYYPESYNLTFERSHGTEKNILQYSLKLQITSGVSRISFRGGVQIFPGKVGVFAWREAPCSAWGSHAFVRGGSGACSPEKMFLKMMQFGAF